METSDNIMDDVETSDNIMDDVDDLELSYSVKTVIESFDKERKIDSLSIFRSILLLHPEYGNSLAKKVDLSGLQVDDYKTRAEWLHKIRELYNVSIIRLLDGKIVLWGLFLLDRVLGRYMITRELENNFLAQLKIEILTDLKIEIGKDPNRAFESILTIHGVESLHELTQLNEEKGKEHYFEQLGILDLHPDSSSAIDLLGRYPFAVFICRYLERLWQKLKDKGIPFLFQIHGPWGSGKTTLLKLLESQLKVNTGQVDNRSLSWIIVWFNAWENQRTGSPPWWSILGTLYDQARKQLPLRKSLHLWLIEHKFRLRHGISHRFFWPSIILGIIGIILLYVDWNAISSITTTDQVLSFLENRLILAITLAGTIVSGILTLYKSLSPGSIQAAKEFVNLTEDPMQKIRKHYQNLVDATGNPIVDNRGTNSVYHAFYLIAAKMGISNHRIEYRPIAVFIDDLDRCDYSYTVELLERIQTLFTGRPVIYIVAADRRWIYTSYEKVYETFKNSLGEPGRPLRSLFLAKVFQCSIPIPIINEHATQRFWNYLTQKEKKEEELSNDFQKSFHEAEMELGKLNTDEQVSKWITTQPVNNTDSIVDYARSAATVVRLASPEVERSIENKLRFFGPLMERNPRFMKRMVDTIIFALAIQILEERPKDFNKLVLWIILCLRWPTFAEFLQQHRSIIEYFHIDKSKGIGQVQVDHQFQIDDQNLELLSDNNVRNVVTGKTDGINALLHQEDIDDILW